MWEIKSVRVGQEQKFLEQGWEPFAVSSHNTSFEFFNTSTNRQETSHQTTDYIYLRKEITEENTAIELRRTMAWYNRER